MIIIRYKINTLIACCPMQNKLRLTTPRTSRAAAAPLPPRRVNSESLFGRGAEVIIQHAGQDYRLRRTRNGKLLLNK
jgi:hemin uptake protein HemP